MSRFSRMLWLSLFLWLLVAGPVCAQWNPLNPVLSVQRESDGVRLALQNGTLKLQVCSDSIIRVRYSPTATFSSRPEIVVIKENWPVTKWEMQSSEYAITLSPAQLKIVVARKERRVTIQHSDSRTWFAQHVR